MIMLFQVFSFSIIIFLYDIRNCNIGLGNYIQSHIEMNGHAGVLSKYRNAFDDYAILCNTFLEVFSKTWKVILILDVAHIGRLWPCSAGQDELRFSG